MRHPTTREIFTELEMKRIALTKQINFIKILNEMKELAIKARNNSTTQMQISVIINGYTQGFHIDNELGFKIFEDEMLKRERQIKETSHEVE